MFINFRVFSSFVSFWNSSQNLLYPFWGGFQNLLAILGKFPEPSLPMRERLQEIRDAYKTTRAEWRFRITSRCFRTPSEWDVRKQSSRWE